MENQSSQSIYCYPGTDVLINKKNIRDKKILHQLEVPLVILQNARLINGEMPFKRDLSIYHILNIHKFLFDDLYDFAGEIREEFINKKNDEIPGEEGVRIYCAPKYIKENLEERLSIMKKEAVRIYTKKNLVDFLAKNYMELYFIHPFRDGNSRTLREFLREYVEIMRDKLINFGDFDLNYTLLSEEDNLNFKRATAWDISNDKEKQEHSLDLLKVCFDKCVVEDILLEECDKHVR